MAPARDWAGVCTFVLCHKTLDTVGTIHFCMVILKHTSSSGHRGTFLSRFSILGGIIIHWCIFSSFCRTTEECVVADWIKGLSISAAHLFCPHFLVFPPRRKLCPRVLNNISTNETKWIWMLVTDVPCCSPCDNTNRVRLGLRGSKAPSGKLPNAEFDCA